MLDVVIFAAIVIPLAAMVDFAFIAFIAFILLVGIVDFAFIALIAFIAFLGRGCGLPFAFFLAMLWTPEKEIAL